MAESSTYFYNVMLVKALLDLTPSPDQAFGKEWIERLDSMTKSGTELCIRADYMWYMLKCLQSGSLSEPFNEVPPPR